MPAPEPTASLSGLRPSWTPCLSFRVGIRAQGRTVASLAGLSAGWLTGCLALETSREGEGRQGSKGL